MCLGIFVVVNFSFVFSRCLLPITMFNKHIGYACHDYLFIGAAQIDLALPCSLLCLFWISYK